MKVIGLIGGMSWESSLEYYRLINQAVRERLGGHHSAKILMYSVDFEEIERFQREDRWEEAGASLAEAAGRLEKGGADFYLLCTNTMHKAADRMAQGASIPFIHIGEATGREIVRQGYKAVGLLGTRFTMEQDFLKGYLSDQYGLEVIVPEQAGRDLVHEVIYEELCQGLILDESRSRVLEIIMGLKDRGAEAVILGCTELPLLVKPGDCPVPILDTTALHAAAAVDEALAH